MKILMICNFGIGDFVGYAMPLASALSENGHQISIFAWRNPQVALLAEEIPFIHSVLHLTDGYSGVSLEEFTKDLDAIIPFGMHGKDLNALWIEKLGLKIFPHAERENPLIGNRNQRILQQFGLPYEKRHTYLSLDWYKDFQKDFNCGENSILIHCNSKGFDRSYMRALDLEKKFIEEGYEVRRINENGDIRESLYLIKQVKHVLTVDTSILWIARALDKKPFCFQYLHHAVTLGLPASHCLKVLSMGVIEPEQIFQWVHSTIIKERN